MTLMNGAEDRGRSDLAQIYLGELMFLMRQKMFQRQMQQAEMAGMMGGQPQAGGMRPDVMPNAATGAPPPPPVPPQNGAVAPGTPRPGAQGQGQFEDVGF